MVARIVAATLRDLSYIAANLRPDDRAEVDCQFDSWSPALLAALSLRDHSYVCELDGNPEAAFGATRHRRGLWIAWSWGTRRMGRCVPRITRFCIEVVLPDIVAQGGLRIEARALAGNEMAVRWLKRLGGQESCLLRAYGNEGQDFLLFEWVKHGNEVDDARLGHADMGVGG